MKKSHTAFDVIVIGGGSSGMMAAGTLASRGKRVLLLEKNKRLGEKLRITGGGRCNITNYELDTRKLLKNYGKSEPYLHSAFAQFGVLETEAFFKQQGITLKIEVNNRAFPHTENATDVEQAMERYCTSPNITVMTGIKVQRLITGGEALASAAAVGVETTQGVFHAARLVIATGGMSHPETGSTGDGMNWLRDLGCETADPTPSLVPLAILERWPKTISGVTLTEIKINFLVDGAKRFSKSGNVLCTHFGFSGPLILNSSKQVADLLHEGRVTGTIDLYPKKDLGILDREVVSFLDGYKNKLFKNAVKDFLPKGVMPALEVLGGKLLARMFDEKVHSISKEDRKEFVRLLKTLPFTVKGLMGFDKAIVADGGVLLSEIDTRTFQLKKHPNIFVTGDVLNINRPSGGFSLQLCWTTGYVAGMHA